LRSYATFSEKNKFLAGSSFKCNNFG